MASLYFTRILRVYTYSSSNKSSLSSSLTIYNQCRRTEKTSNLILNNNPSYSGSSALFAHLYYTHLQIPHLIFPFPSVEPLSVRVEDLNVGGAVGTCYLLDFVGPKGFFRNYLRYLTVFDHNNLAVSKIPSDENAQIT
ncbi:hypothetical protein MKX01_036739 [Papaver californicum]|nr:hypothetical protein MKX01_036739 [Papaver californicum]